MSMLDDLLSSPGLPGARCTETDPEVFFPPKGGSPAAAKRVCMRCEVREACLEQTLDIDERKGLQHGVWAGLSPKARAKLLRERRHREAEAAAKAA